MNGFAEPLAYAVTVSVKGDARSEAPSSGARRFPRLLGACDHYASPAFAGFVLLHCAGEALRARQRDALVEAGFELAPEFVLSVLLVVWLPFAVFAWRELRRDLTSAAAGGEKARALAVLERITLGVVVLFTALHVAQIGWPLLSGELAPSDVRPELVAKLSSTQLGVPLLAAGHLCGVAAAAFLGARQALRALGESAPRAFSRGAAVLGVLAYLLGSYAVIRTAGGVILP